MTIEPVPTSVASMWHAAAERWGVSPRTALLLWLAPFALMIVVAGLRLLAHALWRELAHDEGPLEVIQFLCLLTHGRTGSSGLFNQCGILLCHLIHL